ncbi:protein of unknown function [Hyphomicrobium sp. 1Nfss2.1]
MIVRSLPIQTGGRTAAPMCSVFKFPPEVRNIDPELHHSKCTPFIEKRALTQRLTRRATRTI